MSKPSKINVVKAKKAFCLFPGIRAITLFGTVYCKSKYDVALINNRDEIDSTLKSHETIHVRQAVSTKDSWFCFYTVYLWQWLCNLPLIFINVMAPYKFIEMELEAYENEDTWSYPTLNVKCTGWKDFKVLSLNDNYRIALDYYNNYRDNHTNNYYYCI